MGETKQEDGSYIIKARGLPWSATAQEVQKFFHDCNVVGEENGVHFTVNKDGRPSGECFVELASQTDMDKALEHNNEHMGKRYIEIQEAKRTEMEWVVNRMSTMGRPGLGDESDGFVRLRGLPFGASKKDIADFFAGIQIAPYGITLTMDQDGRPSGDAYVEFTSGEEAEKAMKKHKEKIGHRYIEVFKSSKHDVKYVVPTNSDFHSPMMNGRPGPYDRPSPGFVGGRGRGRGGPMMATNGFANGAAPGGGNFPRGGGTAGGGRGTGGMMRGNGRPMGGGGGGGQCSTTGHMIHMRGLPFEATVSDVYQFFAPLNPVEVRLTYEESGRPKGECDVDFATHADCEAAMSKDKQNMGHRYIELFLKSTTESSTTWPTTGGSASTNNGSMLPGPFGQSSAPQPSMNGNGNSMGGGYGTNGGGYGSTGYGAAPGGGMAGTNGTLGAGNYGAVGSGGNFNSSTSNYSSFPSNGTYNTMTASSGNYYSSMR